MGWKDFISFNRSERNGIIVFAIILIIVIAYPYLWENFLLSQRTINPDDFKNEIIAFENQLQKIEEETNINKIAKFSSTNKSFYTDPALNLNLFEFDPNKMSKQQWRKLGMPERIVRTIKNFEAAGGSFRYKEDVKKIYGITDEIYDTLESHINLPSRHSYINDFQSKYKPKIYKPEKFLIIDINSADSLELLKIQGIGPAFSSRIVRYRSLLGGFTNINQLKEVFGLDEEKYQSIKNQITIQDTIINKININKADFGGMARHPYIDNNLSNNLIQLRQQHGIFSKVEDIKKSHLVDDKTFAKIMPYLSIEE